MLCSLTVTTEHAQGLVTSWQPNCIRPLAHHQSLPLDDHLGPIILINLDLLIIGGVHNGALCLVLSAALSLVQLLP